MTNRIKPLNIKKELFIKTKEASLNSTPPTFSRDPINLFCRLNDYAFFLNYSERFADAEKVLKVAGRVGLPIEYGCFYKIFWKNLGVSLEHQGRYEEAAECYLKAVCRSGQKYGAVKYLEKAFNNLSLLPVVFLKGTLTLSRALYEPGLGKI